MIDLKRITVITGHYGSGKTNIAVNLAVQLKKLGKSCTLVDLDIVNPYFRSADFKAFLFENNITLSVSKYANSNLDIPSLGIDINGITNRENEHVIIDVGGDDAGAIALGRYSDILGNLQNCGELDMLYVINAYRYLTKDTVDALFLMREIERVSKLKCTGIINNSNLGFETTASDIINSFDYADEIAANADLPIKATAANIKIDLNAQNILPVKIYVKAIWND